MNNSEKNFKDYLSGNIKRYEAQQNVPEPDWNDLQNRMNARGKFNNSKAGRYIAMSAAAVIAASSLFYVFSGDIQKEDTVTEYAQRTARPAAVKSIEEDIQSEVENSIFSREAQQTQPRRVKSAENQTAKRTENRATPEANTDSRPATALGTSFQTEEIQNENVTNTADTAPGKETNDVLAGEDEKTLNVRVSPVKRTFCVGEVFDVTTSEPVDSKNLELLNSLTLDMNENGELILAEPGTYKFRIDFTVDGAKGFDETEVVVVPRPETRIESQMNLVDGGRPQYEFRAESSNYTAIRRWVNGQVRHQEGDLVEDFTKKGTYEVMQVAYSAAGCTDTAFKTINVNDDYNLLAPDAFTPNGDGLNDTWLPVALKDPVYEFTLEIRDIQGNVVFKTSDPGSEWRGPENPSRNNAAAQNTFIWKAEVKYKGNIEYYGGAVRVLY